MTVSSAVAWSLAPGRLTEGPRWHEERQELKMTALPSGPYQLRCGTKRDLLCTAGL